MGSGTTGSEEGSSKFKGEEKIREQIQGVSDASGACLGDEDVMATIVGECGGEPETADPMMGP